MGKHEPLTNAERTARRRAKLRAQGLRPKQFWLPDINDPKFIAEARRQSRLAAESADAKEVQQFLDFCFDEILADIEKNER